MLLSYNWINRLVGGVNLYVVDATNLGENAPSLVIGSTSSKEEHVYWR